MDGSASVLLLGRWESGTVGRPRLEVRNDDNNDADADDKKKKKKNVWSVAQ